MMNVSSALEMYYKVVFIDHLGILTRQDLVRLYAGELENIYSLSKKFESCSSKVYFIQHYVMRIVSLLRQVGGFLRVL